MRNLCWLFPLLCFILSCPVWFYWYVLWVNNLGEKSLLSFFYCTSFVLLLFPSNIFWFIKFYHTFLSHNMLFHVLNLSICNFFIPYVGDAAGILQQFKGWFEDDSIRKVWHNYGFDRHVMNNEGKYVRTFINRLAQILGIIIYWIKFASFILRLKCDT